VLVPFWTVRGPYGLLALLFPRMRNSYGRVFLQDRSGQDLTHSPELLTCAREELGQVLFQATVAALACFRCELVLYYYLIPAAVTGLFAGYRVLMEHDYVRVTDRKLSTIIATTTDHNLGPFGRVFFAPRNIGYHIVHHLHPQVALENLPALRLWYKQRHPRLYPGPYGAPPAA
jgi:fatty acid desaturase